MRLSLSLAALGLLQQQAACTSAAASANTVVGKKASLRRTAAAARATHKRRLIETDADFDEDTELRQDDLDEEFEPEAPLNPTNVTQPIEAEPMNPIEPVPENLPEPDEPMPENPTELPDNCKDCLGKDSAGAFAFVAEDATGTGKCVVSCDSIPLEVGETCYSGAENDDKICKDLEKAAQEAAKLAEEEAKLAEEEAAAAAEEEAAAAEAEEDAAPPLPSDLTTCEACLGPDAQGQIYAWFPKLGDGGACLSGCGVNNDSPCFTGAIYTDENCDGIAEAMAKLDEATAAPTDAADDEEEEDMMPTATPTMVEVEATMAPTKEGGATTTGTPTMIIPPEGEGDGDGMMEPTSEPSMPIAAVPTSMPIAAVPTFVTPEPTAGGDEVDVEDAIECPEGYTSDTFFTQADGDLCNICTGPPVTTLPEVEGNSTEPVEPIVEECTVTCGSDACDFAPVGCGVVICPGDLTADPTATPTVMTTMAPTTATPTMMPTATVTSTTVAPTMMTEPTAAPTATDAPTPEVASGTTGRAVATGIVGAVATATAYLLMA